MASYVKPDVPLRNYVQIISFEGQLTVSFVEESQNRFKNDWCKPQNATI